jgi:hypothetical protein
MTNDKGQYLCYNKVDGAIVTGNEVGAMHALSSILYGLSILGLQSLRTWILIGLGLWVLPILKPIGKKTNSLRSTQNHGQ